MSKFLKSSRFSNANAALKLRRDDESRKRDAYLSKDWRRSKPSSSPRSWFSFCSLCPSSSSSSRTSFFFALRKRFQTAVVSHWMPPHVSNNKSFRLASSCALYIIRLILTRALRSTVVGVMLSLFPSATRRSGGSTLEEKLAGFFSREKPRFFSQTLNPKRKRKISQKLNCNFQTHTHTETRLNAFHTTRAKRNTRISRSKRTEEYFLSLFFFGVLLILDTNFASLARAFSALFGIERIYGPCPHSTLLQK